MNLIIDIDKPISFVKNIVKLIVKEIFHNLYLQNFTKIDIEMNDIYGFEDIDELLLSKEIILYALDNLIIVKRSRHWSIEFNPIINYPNTKIKLITLLKFISYGNSNVHGNTILIDAFKKLNKNLDKLYKIYLLRGYLV